MNFVLQMMTFGIENDEFCINNDGFKRLEVVCELQAYCKRAQGESAF